MSLFIIFITAITTLSIVVLASWLAKKYGIHYLYFAQITFSVLASIFANKLILFGPYIIQGGIFLISASFLITDVISEFWGKKEAETAVWGGVFSLVILTISQFLFMKLDPVLLSGTASTHPLDEGLRQTPRLAIASIAAYFIGQKFDVFLYHFWMKKSSKRMLWLRNNFSTIPSQTVDSIIFVTLGLSFTYPLHIIIKSTISLCIAKYIIAILDTPFIYFIKYLIFKDSDSINNSVIGNNVQQS